MMRGWWWHAPARRVRGRWSHHWLLVADGQRQLQRLDLRSGTRRNCRRILRVEPVLVSATCSIIYLYSYKRELYTYILSGANTWMGAKVFSSGNCVRAIAWSTHCTNAHRPSGKQCWSAGGSTRPRTSTTTTSVTHYSEIDTRRPTRFAHRPTKKYFEQSTHAPCKHSKRTGEANRTVKQ